MRLYFLSMAVVTAVSSSCKPQTGTAQFNAGSSVQAIRELTATFSEAEKSAQYASRLRELRSHKLSDFTASLATKMSAGKVVFNGQTYTNLKGAMAPHLKLMAKASAVDTYVGSLGTLFATFGLSSAISSDDMEAYLKAADTGLKALATSKVPSNQQLRPLVQALHVAVALDAITISQPGANLISTSGGQLDYCSNFGGGLASNANWLCQKDSLGGSIGYLSASDPNMWQDAFKPESKAKICPDAYKGIGTEWGWIQDASQPNGGIKCHNAITKSATQESDFCNTASGRAVHSECDKVGATPAPSPPAPASPPSPS